VANALDYDLARCCANSIQLGVFYSGRSSDTVQEAVRVAQTTGLVTFTPGPGRWCRPGNCMPNGGNHSGGKMPLLCGTEGSQGQSALVDVGGVRSPVKPAKIVNRSRDGLGAAGALPTLNT
jgi:hypothetical protein